MMEHDVEKFDLLRWIIWRKSTAVRGDEEGVDQSTVVV